MNYQQWRAERKNMRLKEPHTLSGIKLAEYLLPYSEGSESYSKKIRQIIAANRLSQWDTL